MSRKPLLIKKAIGGDKLKKSAIDPIQSPEKKISSPEQTISNFDSIFTIDNNPPPKESRISEILPFCNLTLSSTAQKTLSTYFSGYREIQSTIDSFGLSFILSFIDYSLHFNHTEKLLMIKDLYDKHYQDMILQDVQKQYSVLSAAINILNSQNTISSKLEQLQEYIEYYYIEFFNMYRNCMMVIAKLNYHSSENEMLRQVFTFEDLKRIVESESSPFPQEMFMYFVEYFKVRICSIDSASFKVDQMGSQLYPPIYVLNLQERFYPLSTAFEYSLRTLKSPHEYQGMIDFMTELETLKNSNATLNEIERKIESEKFKLSESIDMFLRLTTAGGQTSCAKSQCLDGGLTDEQNKIIKEIICDGCDCLNKTYWLECKHNLCVGCYYQLVCANPVNCPKCGVRAYVLGVV